jgi:cytochrome o ubiquinol oxidase subunit II
VSRKYKFGILGLAAISLIGLAIWYFGSFNVAVLDPKGLIGQQEKGLVIFALLLSLIVVVPVFVMLFGFAWKYRASNPKPAKYSPSWDHNSVLEAIWWLVPTVLIVILSVVAWRSSHELDPFKPLQASAKPVNIQVIALDWKWLFIYPQQGVASVNYITLPEKTPVNFTITADAPMNSFWIPQLGGQIYAMPGMSTELHLQADQTGKYRGSSANISGEGFAGMTFTAQAVSRSDFDQWVTSAKQSGSKLDLQSYNRLAQPSQNNPPAYYALADQNIYNVVVMKYMRPILGAEVR